VIFSFRYESVLILLITILFLGCAEVAGPPGGPKDETAPTVISTIPLANAVNAIIDNKISILYSESIDRKSTEDALFITPRPSGKLDYKWRKNNLTITLPDSFEEDRTYIVNVGANVRDIRGNRMENSYSFAFSTGETIDRGKISGFIFQDDKPKAGISVGLFDNSVIDSIKYLELFYPPYMTQSGKTGEFVFEYLPYGKYLVLAFEDKNKNQLLNYPLEKIGVPDKIVRLSQEELSASLNINLITGDTVTQSIISAAQTEDNLIKIRFSRPVASELVQSNLNNIFLRSTGSSYQASAVKESDGGEMSSYHFYFADLMDDTYQIILRGTFIGNSIIDTNLLESSEFSFRRLADSSQPALEYFSHTNKKIFPDKAFFELGFSEPMYRNINLDSAVIIYDTADVQQDIIFEWVDEFRLGGSADKLDWGKYFFVVINQKSLVDLNGNILGDSISVFNLSTYSLDSLGKVSGEVLFKSGQDTGVVHYLTISNLAGKGQFTQAIEDNRFKFRIPPGKYQLKGYLDINNNGRHDVGSLVPFQFAEKMVLATDTIRVRNRFETAGLKFEF